jgi:hypothetical protein
MSKGRNKKRPRGPNSIKTRLPTQGLIQAHEGSVRNRWQAISTLAYRHIPVWGVVLTLLSVAVAVVGIVVAYRLAWNVQTHSEEQKTSAIHYAFSIHPIPMPSRPLEGTNRWEVSVMIRNGGPATAQALVFHLQCPNPDQFPNSEPIVISRPSTATVDVLSRTPPGYYQVVFKNLPPGDGAMLAVYFEARESFREDLYNNWKKGMFSKEFAKRFIDYFQLTGENIKVENEGAVDFKPFGDE